MAPERSTRGWPRTTGPTRCAFRAGGGSLRKVAQRRRRREPYPAAWRWTPSGGLLPGKASARASTPGRPARTTTLCRAESRSPAVGARKRGYRVPPLRRCVEGRAGRCGRSAGRAGRANCATSSSPTRCAGVGGHHLSVSQWRSGSQRQAQRPDDRSLPMASLRFLPHSWRDSAPHARKTCSPASSTTWWLRKCGFESRLAGHLGDDQPAARSEHKRQLGNEVMVGHPSPCSWRPLRQGLQPAQSCSARSPHQTTSDQPLHAPDGAADDEVALWQGPPSCRRSR